MRGDLRRLFGTRVRELRLQRKLSQEGLAERANLHRNYIGGIERGERNVGLDNIVALAKALRVPPSDLFSLALRERVGVRARVDEIMRGVTVMAGVGAPSPWPSLHGRGNRRGRRRDTGSIRQQGSGVAGPQKEPDQGAGAEKAGQKASQECQHEDDDSHARFLQVEPRSRVTG